MSKEFERARFEANEYLGGEHHDIWNDGADWAYEWCENRHKIRLARFTNSVRDKLKAADKLAEALEHLLPLCGPVTHEEAFLVGNANKILKEYRGEK